MVFSKYPIKLKYVCYINDQRQVMTQILVLIEIVNFIFISRIKISRLIEIIATLIFEISKNNTMFRFFILRKLCYREAPKFDKKKTYFGSTGWIVYV